LEIGFERDEQTAEDNCHDNPETFLTVYMEGHKTEEKKAGYIHHGCDDREIVIVCIKEGEKIEQDQEKQNLGR
jgi:hypothetical protein